MIKFKSDKNEKNKNNISTNNFISADFLQAYPIDGYTLTGIRRLLRLQLILDGSIKDTKPIPGALKSINDIKLNLVE